MAFKMKYSPNKKTGSGFPFKKVDDIQTQNMIVGELEDAYKSGASQHDMNQIVKSKSDATTTYVIGKDGKVRTTATKAYKDPKTGDTTHMDNVYHLEKGEGGKTELLSETDVYNPALHEGGKEHDVTVSSTESPSQGGMYDFKGQYTRTLDTHTPDDITSVDVESGEGAHQYGGEHEQKSLGGKILGHHLKQNKKK